MDDFFAPPPFKPAEALAQLRRQLRELRPLAERGNGFELRGQVVLELEAAGETINVKMAKRPARTPEWTHRTLASSADVRDFVAAVKAQLARWSDE